MKSSQLFSSRRTIQFLVPNGLCKLEALHWRVKQMYSQDPNSKFVLMTTFAFTLAQSTGYGHLDGAVSFPSQIVESAGCIFNQSLGGGSALNLGLDTPTSCWCPLNSSTLFASSDRLRSADAQWRAGFLVCSCTNLANERIRQAARQQPSYRQGCRNIENTLDCTSEGNKITKQ